MSVVGTAGHVDHGKSTLLQALTGRDPDRWAEEKERGLTIDLGFVWARLPSGREVSFVDVPGHERFIKNMLAGIESVDVALFVVAADEGWMPQSEEHLAVLDLLGVERAVVALTKIDRVDDDLVELATLEVLESLEGTTLASSPVIPVSATEGTGLDTLIETLDSLVEDPPAATEPRLWVDRRFTISGAGTVVTGTLLGAPIAIGDTLVSYPGGNELRVRGIESHEQALETVEPHRRVALNLAGETGNLKRGSMLGLADRWLPSPRFTASLRTARYVDELGEKGAYQVHIGSVAVPARIRPVSSGALVTLDRAVPVRYGDRFILRETGRRAVVGGGVVLDPDPPRRGRRLAASADLRTGLDPTAAANELVTLRRTDTPGRILAHTGASPSEGATVGPSVISPAELGRLEGAALAAVSGFHTQAPLRPGLPLATLASQLRVDSEVAEFVVLRIADLRLTEGVVAESSHSLALTAEQEQAWENARSVLAEAGLTPPRIGDLSLDPELVHALARRGDLVAVSDEFLYLTDQIEEITRAIGAMEDGFTVADFRDRHGLSRKYAVPLLEWADKTGLTKRQGDRRSPRRDQTG